MKWPPADPEALNAGTAAVGLERLGPSGIVEPRAGVHVDLVPMLGSTLAPER